MEEIWKDIEGYEGIYCVSNMGRVKSLKKGVETILKPFDKGKGYLAVDLNVHSVSKKVRVHQLVAKAFLGHTPSGMELVINHKNRNRSDNSVDNLEVITNRKNCHFKHIGTSSKYIGVCWDKSRNKWQSQIMINGKIKLLGRLVNEDDAGKAYQDELRKIL